MQTIDLARLSALLHGHVGLLAREDAVQPVRLPPEEMPLHDPHLRRAGAMTAGVRLRLRTDSRALHLATRQQKAVVNGAEPWPARYELFVDEEPWSKPIAAADARAAAGTKGGDESAMVAIEGLPPGWKGLELWMPQGASVAICGLCIDEGASLASWPDPRPTIVFHGSSITQGAECETGTGSWPSVAAGLAGAQAVNLGLAGSCLMSGLAARMVRDRPAERIVLELGINVWGQIKERTFHENAHAMLAIIRDGHADTPITVVSPIFSALCEREDEEAALSLDAMRDLLERVVAERTAIGDAAIGYLSGLELLGPSEGDSLADGVHPRLPAYRRIGERFFEKALSEKALRM